MDEDFPIPGGRRMRMHSICILAVLIVVGACAPEQDDPLTEPGPPLVQLPPPDVRVEAELVGPMRAYLEVYDRGDDAGTLSHLTRFPCFQTGTDHWRCAGEAYVGQFFRGVVGVTRENPAGTCTEMNATLTINYIRRSVHVTVTQCETYIYP